jgi:lipopolysaccharide transport system ATP-binding protein
MRKGNLSLRSQRTPRDELGMSDVIISVEHLSKRYRLGEIGVTTLRESAERLWHKFRGRDPDDHMGKVGAGRAKVAKLQSCKVTELAKDASTSAPCSSRGGSASGRNPVTLETLSPCNSETSDSELWALKDVSFEVKRGEVLGIIGRNGAGKSTLLKILSRITDPTSGRAIMRGRVGSLLEVGTGFHPELTGRENIFLNGAILGMKKKEIEVKFDEIVAFAEVERFIDTPVKRYSSGMYVRLAFAVAAHLDPEILLVDEVLAVGDAGFQKKCLGKMGEVAHAGRTVLFVSHNMGAITRLCGRALLLDGGQMEMHDKTEAVVSHYLLSDISRDGERIWKDGLANPGVVEFRFKAARILNADGYVTSSLDVRMPFRVEMEYEIVEPVRSCQLAINFMTSDGLIVFQSFDSDKNDVEPLRKPGIYTSTCHVPGNLLNTGQYVLTIYADLWNERVLAMCENALRFDIQNTEIVGPYPVRYGYVRPVLEWEQRTTEHA